MVLEIVSTLATHGIVQGIRKFLPSKSLRNKYIENFQLAQLRKLASHAFHRSEFYHTLYTHHGIKERDLNHLHFKDLPIVTKKQITENKQRVFTDSSINFDSLYNFIYQKRDTQLYKNKYYSFTTSGSLGSQMIVIYSKAEWNKILTITAMGRLSFPELFFKKVKVAGILRTTGTSAGSIIFRALPPKFHDMRELSILSSIDEIIDELNAFQPHCIASYPGIFASLIPHQKSGRLKVFPQMIKLGGEILTDAYQQEIRECFKAKVVNEYGASECMVMGNKTVPHAHFNLTPQYSKVEILNDKNEHVAPGEKGRVVVTNFINYTQPFIRYEIGDIALFDLNARGEPSIKEFVSRNYKPVYFENNQGEKSYFHPFALYEMLLYMPGIEKSQIILGNNSLHARVLASDQGIANVTNRFQTFLNEQNLDKKVKFTIDRVNEIRPEPNGKIPFIKYDTQQTA